MNDLLDFLDVADGGRAGHVPVVHIITPDFATLCRDDYLEASDRGDRCAINPHREGVTFPAMRWRNITCPWCRALGHAYYRHVCALMNGRQA